MRTVLLGLVLVVEAMACGPAAAPRDRPKEQADGLPATPHRPLRPLGGQVLVSYNVENLFDTVDDPLTDDEEFLPAGDLHWTAERYRHKLAQLARAIAWTAKELPPIVGLIEVENRAVVEDLVRTPPLDRGDYAVLHFDSPDERGIDVALLVRRPFATVLHTEPLALTLPGNDRTRDVLYARLAIAEEQELHVLQCHWPSRRKGVAESEPERMAAARLVRRRVDAVLSRDPQARVLIMGDFNDHPQDRSIREGLGAGCDRRDGSDLIDLMCTDPGREGVDGSYLHQGRWGYLDQMIVSQALASGPGLHAVLASAFADDRLLFRHPKYGPAPDKTYNRGAYKGGFSDHLPVVLRLR